MRLTTAGIAAIALAVTGCGTFGIGDRAPPDSGLDLLREAVYVTEGWCWSPDTSEQRAVWLCRIYKGADGRKLIAFHHALSGKLLAVATPVADGERYRILWKAPPFDPASAERRDTA